MNNLTGDVCSFATLMVYKIPMEDIKSLAKSFSELEKGELNIPEPKSPKKKSQRNFMIVDIIYSFIFKKNVIFLYLQPNELLTLKNTTSPSPPWSRYVKNALFSAHCVKTLK